MALAELDPEMLEAAALRGRVVFLGPGADMDEAFDQAVSRAFNEPTPFAHLITGADPGALEPAEAATSFDLALRDALAWESPTAGAVLAVPLLPRSAHARRTLRLRLTDPRFEVDSSAAAAWSAFDADLGAAVRDALAAEHGLDTTDEGDLERSVVKRRAKYKAVSVTNRGSTGAEFVVLNGDRIVSRGHRTAGEARKAAVALVRDVPCAEHDLFTLEVRKLVGRAEGLPLATITRTRVSQALSLALVWATRKPTTRAPKVEGWLFAVSSASATTPDDEVGEAETEQAALTADTSADD